jgi:DNA-3-methyladenine glycosylase II
MEIPSVLLKDKVMANIIAATPLLPIASTKVPDIYLSLLNSIVSQQLSTKAAATIYDRFLNLFEHKYPTAATLLATDIDDLRKAGLSQQKANYLKNVAAYHLEKTIDFEQLSQQTDEEIIAALTTIKGVGKWTVEMLLMFVLHRPNVFPIDDLVIRKKIILAYDVAETGKALYPRLTEIATAWEPHRTLACRYLWAWKA